MECNYTDRKVSLNNQVVICKRGESLNSLDTWAKRWRCNKSKVRRFFEKLESDSMIRRESLIKTTRLIVCNYDSYNAPRHLNDTQTAFKRHASDIQTTPNKKDKKVKKDKKEGNGVPPPPPSNGSRERKEYTEEQKAAFDKFQNWILKHAPDVALMKKPFTIEEFVKISVKYDHETVSRQLKAMDNWLPLLKKCKSAYLTFTKWTNKDADNKPAQPLGNALTQKIKEAVTAGVTP